MADDLTKPSNEVLPILITKSNPGFKLGMHTAVDYLNLTPIVGEYTTRSGNSLSIIAIREVTYLYRVLRINLNKRKAYKVWFDYPE